MDLWTPPFQHCNFVPTVSSAPHIPRISQLISIIYSLHLCPSMYNT